MWQYFDTLGADEALASKLQELGEGIQKSLRRSDKVTEDNRPFFDGKALETPWLRVRRTPPEIGLHLCDEGYQACVKAVDIGEVKSSSERLKQMKPRKEDLGRRKAGAQNEEARTNACRAFNESGTSARLLTRNSQRPCRNHHAKVRSSRQLSDFAHDVRNGDQEVREAVPPFLGVGERLRDICWRELVVTIETVAERYLLATCRGNAMMVRYGSDFYIQQTMHGNASSLASKVSVG